MTNKQELLEQLVSLQGIVESFKSRHRRSLCGISAEIGDASLRILDRAIMHVEKTGELPDGFDIAQYEACTTELVRTAERAQQHAGVTTVR